MPNKKYITLENLQTYRQEDKAELDAALLLKQDNLVSGTNIKTINGESILGAGDVQVGNLEIVVYQNTAPLTAAQLAKAQAGKLAVYKDGRFYHESYAGNSLINYSCFEAGHEISASVNVNDIITIKEYKIILDTSTGMLNYTGYMSVSGVGDYANNYFAATAAPTASSKQLVRALNLYRTQAMMAAAYSDASTYDVGDVVIYENELYLCNTDINPAESWDSTHWDKLTLVELMDEKLSIKLDKKPDGTNNLISSATGKVSETYLPDYILGQLLYGGLFDSTTATATLSDGAKGRLGTSAASIVLTNDATPITGYVANEGIYYVVSAAGTFAGLNLVAGDWLISTGSAWQKVDNTDEVTSVNGMTGAVTLTKGDIGLGNVDNTSDLDKPISTAVQAALDEKVDEADMDDFELDSDQVASKPFLGSVTVGEDTYNVPKKFSDLQDDVGLLYVDDQSANALATISAADWADLKANHYLKASASVFPTAEETRYKLSINGVNHLVRVSKNSDSQAKAMFMAQETVGSDVFYYELTMFMIAVSANSTALVFRCATVMSEPGL